MKLEASKRLKAYLDSADQKLVKDLEKKHKDLNAVIEKLSHSTDESVAELAEDMQDSAKSISKSLKVMRAL